MLSVKYICFTLTNIFKLFIHIFQYCRLLANCVRPSHLFSGIYQKRVFCAWLCCSILVRVVYRAVLQVAWWPALEQTARIGRRDRLAAHDAQTLLLQLDTHSTHMQLVTKTDQLICACRQYKYYNNCNMFLVSRNCSYNRLISTFQWRRIYLLNQPNLTITNSILYTEIYITFSSSIKTRIAKSFLWSQQWDMYCLALKPRSLFLVFACRLLPLCYLLLNSFQFTSSIQNISLLSLYIYRSNVNNIIIDI